MNQYPRVILGRPSGVIRPNPQELLLRLRLRRHAGFRPAGAGLLDRGRHGGVPACEAEAREQPMSTPLPPQWEYICGLVRTSDPKAGYTPVTKKANSLKVCFFSLKENDHWRVLLFVGHLCSHIWTLQWWILHLVSLTKSRRRPSNTHVVGSSTFSLLGTSVLSHKPKISFRRKGEEPTNCIGFLGEIIAVDGHQLVQGLHPQ